MLAIYVGFFSVFSNPHGPIAIAFSLFPFTSPIVMLMRLPGGIGEGGPLPVDLKSCGPTCFWLFEGLMLLLLLLFAVHVRSNILHRAESGGPLISEIEWNSKNTISYPLLSICAGLVAGLFGVGGGIVQGPLMLALGKRSGF